MYGREHIDDASEDRKESWLLKAQKVISKIEFLAMLFSKQPVEIAFINDLIVALRNELASLINDENFTKAAIYRSAANSLEQFVTEVGITNKTQPKVPFGLITKDFLKNTKSTL
ncbi:hypothetical protein [Dyadobacter sp. OTU695]|uniref:hypothetical protein n=1 Tax=Dyadobacter sp. OTU695 TaxID=3043860 RepID=UPI00313C7004